MTIATGITEAGIYDMPAEVYHADPIPGGSLSSTGARLILPPNTPAHFRYAMDHDRPPKAEFDIGHAAHQRVLGAGPTIAVVDADSWRTNAAKDAAAEARERGEVPLLRGVYDQVEAMAAALRADPHASMLLDPGSGAAERAIFWPDPVSGVWCRALIDWLRHRTVSRTIVVEYKSVRNASTEALSRAVYEYGYHIQGVWYDEGVRAVGLSDTPGFLLVAQEKTPPYLVNVVQLTDVAVQIGRTKAREAVDLYASCVANGAWPGYTRGVEDEIPYVSLPPWVENAYLRETF